MATFNPLHPLESSIIELIASPKGITIRDVHEKINSEGVSVSLNGIYKPINRMLDCQMLVKAEGELFINSVWLQHISQFNLTAGQNHLPTRSDDISLPLKEGQRHDFHADSLQSLDSIWNHLVTKLTPILKDDSWYVYNSHPWHSLGMRDTEQRLYESIISHGKEVFMVFGNETFLDTYGQKLVTANGYHTTIVSDSPFLQDGYALWVCDDHIVECIFPEIISRNFLFFFQSVQNISNFNQTLFSDVFKMKCNCKITVRCDTKEANRIKSLFKGILAS